MQITPSTPPAQPSAPPEAPQERPPESTSEVERGTLSKAATAVAVLGSAVKGFAIDRPRILAAYPLARENGRTARWAAELVSGRATYGTVPITGGTITVGGRTLTTQAWKLAYRTSNSFGVGLTTVGALYAIPNLVDGWKQGGGITGLHQSRAGRTGMIATVSSALDFALLGTALVATRGQGSGNRILRALSHPILSSTGAQVGRISLGMPLVANELGYFDSLNTGSAKAQPASSEPSVVRENRTQHPATAARATAS